jgi:hypothetical protein
MHILVLVRYAAYEKSLFLEDYANLDMAQYKAASNTESNKAERFD